jgi:hypothetical protein
MLILLTTLLACFGATGGPCEEYCTYMCDCHAGDSDFSCDQCRNEYPDADPALQDACETALTDQISADEANAYECADVGGANDTAAGR